MMVTGIHPLYANKGQMATHVRKLEGQQPLGRIVSLCHGKLERFCPTGDIRHLNIPVKTDRMTEQKSERIPLEREVRHGTIISIPEDKPTITGHGPHGMRNLIHHLEPSGHIGEMSIPLLLGRAILHK